VIDDGDVVVILKQNAITNPPKKKNKQYETHEMKYVKS